MIIPFISQQSPSGGSPMAMQPAMFYQQPMTDIKSPHSNDVLCGRGVTTNRHTGNEGFRSLVNCNKVRHIPDSIA
jgi:hypothetical protein